MAIRAPVRANNPAFRRPTPGMPFHNEMSLCWLDGKVKEKEKKGETETHRVVPSISHETQSKRNQSKYMLCALVRDCQLADIICGSRPLNIAEIVNVLCNCFFTGYKK